MSDPTTPEQHTSEQHTLTSPDLSWNDQGLPVSRQFDDPYFSVEDGLNESRYVFLQHNQLPQRWEEAQGEFNIVETGFGTGLNFLMTWQSFAEQKNTASATDWLHFTSIEKFPLNKAELQQAMSLWPELADLTRLLLQQYPLTIAGFHHLIWPEHKVRLTLIFDDVHNALPQLSGPVHAWYLDGFAPSKNPQMWGDALFQQMRRINNRHPYVRSTVATFTAAGVVRRGIKGAGFRINKVPGFGRKREMLAGEFNLSCGPEQPAFYREKPWLISQAATLHADAKENVIVIGAGLAGCTTARALAERGHAVTLIDRQGIAQAASGNPQGGLYIKLAAGDNAMHTQFYLAAFQHSLERVKHTTNCSNRDDWWHNCGVLQLAYDDKEQQRQQKFLRSKQYPQALITAVNAEQASDLAGCPQETGGLYFPQAGWVAPGEFCQQLIQHPLITFAQRDIQSLEPADSGSHRWQLHDSNNQSHEADQVVIANAYDAKQLLPDAYLPVKRIRGQLSILDSSLVPDIKTVLCARSYMAPTRNGLTCLGATYNLNDDDLEVRAQDHMTNLDHLQDFGPAWAQTDAESIAQGRVGFRCTTPDYLPMIGSIPDTQRFIEAFRPMVKNAKQIPKTEAPVMAGLWLNIGHGSRGLASAPLCAELLAAQITNGGKPVAQEVEAALWPGRFLLRDMMRRKIS
ncbi:bifunctional tRNA (5-methylaminomethyl-2-thiouridine)(34)-methyltransferase MnmD/FAD-dependent 5-carboxymethylaminomethyl-2-thiouridine(34) oxidoreductase MnmC [Bacterioplanoides sp.]|uniref:bifunctional tRNA (5-methylaminomethyl-2-thiouridine)(34)-methyltransferase MnmD/FAD-dependent 5-carboxymethylaminomethyl-2-thiouridine(34) oxidoreductase MnmC n=1 Tax=Bacterioplanoides sp. TaxID=2066072 RepID=UPI003AFFFD71